MKSWNRERKRTRDRLLKCDMNELLPSPYTNVIDTIYPWTNQSLGILQQYLYEIAKKHGFTGEKDKLFERFSKGTVTYATIDTFPIHGSPQQLYLDNETDVLYYAKTISQIQNIQQLYSMGIIISDTVSDENNTLYYLYIPIRALPIENLIFSGGTAADYID